MDVIPTNASAYFQALADLIRLTQASDAEEKVLTLDNACDRVVDELVAVKRGAGKTMIVGNGGSSAIASHMQNDLAKAAGMRSLVFNETPLLSALSNDIGYETVFEFPINQWAAEGDLLIAISSSGGSESILRAVSAARGRGARVVTLSGFTEGNPLRRLGDINFFVASRVYGFVETAHSAIAHFFVDRATVAGAS